MRIEYRNKEKTTFTSHYVLYIPLLLLALKNVLSTSRSQVDIVFLTVKGQLLSYTLKISSSSQISSKDTVPPTVCIGTTIHSRCIIGIEKCFFFEDCTCYFGHEMQPARLGMSTKVTNANRKLQSVRTTLISKRFLYLQRILLVCTEIRLHSHTVEPQFGKGPPFLSTKLNKIEINAPETP